MFERLRERMARRGNVITAVAAVVLGILAVALSFVAYAKRIKVEDVSISVDGKSCTYPSSPAFAIGIVAALCLLFQQIILSVGTGCFCSKGKCSSNNGGIVAVFLFFVSWLFFCVAFIFLIRASTFNNSNSLANSNPGTVVYKLNNSIRNFCNMGKDNMFLQAAIFSISSMVTGLMSFIVFNNGAWINPNHTIFFS